MHVRKLCSSGDGKVGEGFVVRAAGLVQCREQSTALREPVGLQKGRRTKSERSSKLHIVKWFWWRSRGLRQGFERGVGPFGQRAVEIIRCWGPFACSCCWRTGAADLKTCPQSSERNSRMFHLWAQEAPMVRPFRPVSGRLGPYSWARGHPQGQGHQVSIYLGHFESLRMNLKASREKR